MHPTLAHVVIDADPHPLGLLSSAGPVSVEAMLEEVVPPGEPMRVAATTPPGAPADGKLASLGVVVGASSTAVWRILAELASVPTAGVHSHVTGTTDRALILGRDAQGNPQVRAHAGDGNTFDLLVPTSVVEWYAAIDPGRSSGLASFVPGTPATLARAAARRDEILSPKTSMASGGGPIQMTPCSVTARAKSAFSEKNP